MIRRIGGEAVAAARRLLGMIETLISNRTRVKLLLKFFLNGRSSGYLRGLESEFGEGSNAIRVELNRLCDAGLLESYTEGNKRMYRADQSHPLYEDLARIVRKHIGLDRVLATVVDRLGELEAAYLAGSLSRGIDSSIIDLVLVGSLDRAYLTSVIARAEELIERKVRYIVYTAEEVAAGALAEFAPPPLLIYTRPTG